MRDRMRSSNEAITSSMLSKEIGTFKTSWVGSDAEPFGRVIIGGFVENFTKAERIFRHIGPVFASKEMLCYS